MTFALAMDGAEGSPLPTTLRRSEYGPLLARSTNCEVFALGEAHVLKLYPVSTTAKEVTRQLDLSRRVHAAGLPVPAALPGLTRNHSDGRLGAVFERVHGRTLTELSRRNPFAPSSLAALLAKQHRLVHAWDAVDDLPPQRQRMRRHINADRLLDPQMKHWLHRALDGLPDGNQVCHGDFGWNNLMVGDHGVTILDWADAAIGDALCDVARTWVIIRFNDGTSSLLVRMYCRALANRYLSSYFGANPPDASLFARWKVLNAALRLRDIQGEAERAYIMKFLRVEMSRLEPEASTGGRNA